MTLPDPSARRKPRRLGLYAPFAALLLALLVWVGGWLWMRDAVFRHMDGQARVLGESGYQLDWSARTLSGFPFRLNLEITGPRVREASGWGLSAPRLKAEAFVFSPDHWVIVAPEGATLIRRVGGPVEIKAQALRASLSDAADHPPRLSIEGLGLKFTAPAGAAPVAISDARELHVHAKAGPADQGALYVELGGARMAVLGLGAALADGAPVDLIADGVFSHASALKGQGLAGALRSWSAAGGVMTPRQLTFRTGASLAEARSGTLTLGADGRLGGTLELTLKPASALVARAAASGTLSLEAARTTQAIIAARGPAPGVNLPLVFQAGQTTLGPVAVGPAPRVY